MSATSTKPAQTLKGIFEQPKIYHRRDFLRENKLSLREMQRLTNKKLTTQQQEEQQKLKRQQAQHQHQQDFYVSRRSASQNRPAAGQQQTQQQRVQHVRQHPRQPRSISQQRIRNPNCTCGAQPSMQSKSTMQSISSNIARNGLYDDGTAVPLLARKRSCHKEIQTEDIQDEGFLYDALRKCTTQDVESELGNRLIKNDDMRGVYNNSNPDENQHNHQNNLNNGSSYHSTIGNHFEPTSNNHENNMENIPISTARSCLSNNANKVTTELYSRGSHTQAKNELPTNRTRASKLNENHEYLQTLNDNMSTLALENDEGQIMPTSQLTARSRHSLQSTQSQDGISLTKKRSNTSLHKLGSRDDIRLPRYLEREKREKEENRLREIERDPNCPLGHFVLTENERLNAIAMAENKFKTLIAELNRMPMTTETLRIRMRKAEIEKELVTIEADLRIFSKSKVYVKQPDD